MEKVSYMPVKLIKHKSLFLINKKVYKVFGFVILRGKFCILPYL